MEFFIMLYRVTIDGEKICYGKAGLASKDLNSDWEEVRSTINKGYKATFPAACRIEIEPVKATKVTMKKFAEFIAIAKGVLN